MNKKVLILFITVILFTNLALLKSSARTKTHDNNLFFTGISNVSFTVKQHCISPKQPYATPDGNQAGFVKHKKMVGINIRAGRHGSKDTVRCVLTNMFDSNTFFDFNFTFNSRENNKTEQPSKFNFAVKGTLAIKGKYFDNIILAQGHTGASNNWWFGGNFCQKKFPIKHGEKVNCTSRDGTQWCFIRGFTNGKFGRNSPDHIKVETKKCTH